MCHDGRDVHQNKAAGARQSNLHVVFPGSRNKVYRKRSLAVRHWSFISARNQSLTGLVTQWHVLCICDRDHQPKEIAMTGNTKAAPRTVRRDATQILTADHKKVSKIFAEYEIEPEKSAPAPGRPGGVQRHA